MIWKSNCPKGLKNCKQWSSQFVSSPFFRLHFFPNSIKLLHRHTKRRFHWKLNFSLFYPDISLKKSNIIWRRDDFNKVSVWNFLISFFKLLYNTCDIFNTNVYNYSIKIFGAYKRKKRRDIKDNVKILKFKPCCKS